MNATQDVNPRPVAGSLRWRIPPEGDPRVLRLRLAQVGLATVVCALVLLVAAPRQALGWALLALVPVAMIVAFRQWHKYRQSLAGPENTWIDDAGVHWLDAAGHEQILARAEIAGFRIAVDEDTLRPMPSLTLYFKDGRESQPLELHPPATPDEVRWLLRKQWRIVEPPAEEDAAYDLGYDMAIEVYSECHNEFQEWHLEGTTAALGELFELIAQSGDLPLPTPGIKPARRVVLARRREASRLTLQHDHQPRIGDGTIAGPAEMLSELAMLGRQTLGKARFDVPEADVKFDLSIGRGSVWTFHLHKHS